MNNKTWLSYLLAGFGAASLVQATPWGISDVPLFVSEAAPPLNMLVLSRDHKLYNEAYNDASDLNEDGRYDVRYFPQDKVFGSTTVKGINYYGYFDSYRCYTYDASGFFNPTSVTTDKKCSGSSEWSGDYLNYLTTSRMDAIRKVLYGGFRSTDNSTTTILERVYIPQDAHSWGKEYTSTAVDGFDIAQYTPLSQPTSGTRHLFANTSLLVATGEPLLRVIENQGNATYNSVSTPVRIWNWVSIERPVAGAKFFHGGNGPNTPTPTDYKVRVKVCVPLGSPAVPEANCKLYGNGTTYKPIGLLQEYGTGNRMLFGLTTGSYQNNLQGGVLRKQIGDINNEINATDGTFSSTLGIIKTIDNLKIVGFGSGYQYDCGWTFATTQLTNGNCKMWGNPLGEIMYEAVRYFAGSGAATVAYTAGITDGNDSGVVLPSATWDNPYSTGRTDGRNWCSKPFMTVISDINPSFDSEVPGTAFSSTVSNSLTGFNARTLANSLWTEQYGTTKSMFIGNIAGGTLAEQDNNPTPKTVGGSDTTSLGSLRGLAPEEPTRQGTYYSAAVAAYARTTDVNTAAGVQNVQTFSIALASPLPRIVVPTSSGKTITFVPFAKSVAGGGISSTSSFQPTNQIVDFYIESIVNDGNTANADPNVNGGLYQAVFQINYEDVENGADHDMDAQARYTISAKDNNTVSVQVDSIYAAGGIAQHMGFVVSGSSADGPYLVVRDCDTAHASQGLAADDSCTVTGNNPGTDPIYSLDRPLRTTGSLPLRYSATFAPGTNPAGEFIKDPLWLAAKFGGFQSPAGLAADASPPLTTPNTTRSSWDEDVAGSPGYGVPDNYFLVVNPVKLKDQLTRAFDEIIRRTASASAVATSSTSVRTDSQIFVAKFFSDNWSGSLQALRLQTNGTLGARLWTASTGDSGSRKIFTTKRGSAVGSSTSTNKQPVSFLWSELGDIQRAALNINPWSGTSDALGDSRVSFLRGDRSLDGTTFRQRSSSLADGSDNNNVIGDIIFSSPKYVGPPGELYTGATYATFKSSYASRKKAVYVGANDGMLHAFDATLSPAGAAIDGTSGRELFAYIPSVVVGDLNRLTSKTYASAGAHRYFVDGSPTVEDAEVGSNWKTVLVGGLNKGGKAIYALDVSDPGTFSASNVLWEFTSADDADLGYTYSRPKIVKLNNGKWVALFGNGYNSSTEKAVLYIVDLNAWSAGRTWTLNTNYRKIDTGITGSNGLSGITPVDIDVDGLVDYVYAGDIKGNMWKFDLTSNTPSLWGVGLGGLPLFVAKIVVPPATVASVQPILAEPKVSLHPTYPTVVKVSSQAAAVTGPKLRGTMVYFGTGAYLETCDTTSSCTLRSNKQSFYGVWDDNNAILTSQAALLQQTITETTNPLARSVSDNAISWKLNNDTGKMGWFVNLPGSNGTERSINTPFVTSEVVLFNTIIPSTSGCEFGGSGWLMCLSYVNGGSCGSGLAPVTMTAAYGGLSLIDSYGGGGAKVARIDQGLQGNDNSTNALYSDASGATQSLKLNLSKKIRLVNWRELINE